MIEKVEPDLKKFQRSEKRSRLYFNLMIGGLVVVVSFVYGLASGLNKRLEYAHAVDSHLFYDASGPAQWSPTLKNLYIPRGAEVEPIGSKSQINGREVEMVSFYSDRTIDDLLAEQVSYWKSIGLKAFGTVAHRRGIAVALDEKTNDKHSMTVFIVPPSVRKFIAHGKTVQGIVTMMSGDDTGTFNVEGVPGVPVMPGGRSGAVFSSEEVGGRSFSGLYTNPGTIEINRNYYKDIMLSSGWQVVSSLNDSVIQGSNILGVDSLEFSKKDKDLTLLFSKSQSTKVEETIVTAVLRPRDIRG